MRAVAMIQPPEAAEAFTGRDDGREPRGPQGGVGRVDEGGRDPGGGGPGPGRGAARPGGPGAGERRPRPVPARDGLPAEAVPLLAECAADPNDGLRTERRGGPGERGPGRPAADTLRRLVEDPNSRIRLIAAGAVLAEDPADAAAGEVVAAALADPALRLRRVGLDVVASLGDHGVGSWTPCAAGRGRGGPGRPGGRGRVGVPPGGTYGRRDTTGRGWGLMPRGATRS